MITQTTILKKKQISNLKSQNLLFLFQFRFRFQKKASTIYYQLKTATENFKNPLAYLS